MVTVTTRDPEGLSSSVDVTIEVTDVNEAPVITVGGLAISGQTSVDYPENGTGPVETYTAVGPDADSARWTLSGEDAGDFTISSGGMYWPSVSTPDFETPADADGNNVYRVTVMADDGTYDAMRMVTVTARSQTWTRRRRSVGRPARCSLRTARARWRYSLRWTRRRSR